MRETWAQSLGREDLLEKEMATHSSILAWKSPQTVEHGRLQSMGSQRVRHDWATSLSLSLSLSNWDTRNLGKMSLHCRLIYTPDLPQWNLKLNFDRDTKFRDWVLKSYRADKHFELSIDHKYKNYKIRNENY